MIGIIHRVKVFEIVSPQINGRLVVGEFRPLNRNRLKQKLDYVAAGRPVAVELDGRPGVIKELPVDGCITIHMLEPFPSRDAAPAANRRKR